jgi:hypothetical protein
VDGDGHIGVAVIDKTVYVKPFGYATQANSLGLPGFIKSMYRQGCTSVTFDLSDCEAMDSTFLGVVAEAAMTGPQHRGKNVLFLNAGEKAREELDMIGLTSLVAFKECEPPDELELSEVDFVHMPDDERARLKEVKRLHERLISLNDRNEANFQSFVEMLGEELRSQQ